MRRVLSTAVSSSDRSSHQKYLALLRGMVNSNDGKRLATEIEGNFYGGIGNAVSSVAESNDNNSAKSALNKFLITSKTFRYDNNKIGIINMEEKKRKKVNLQRLIALVSLSKYANDIELAFDMVECVSVSRDSTGFMVVGLMEIIDHCVAYAQLDNAMIAYNRLRNMGHGLDALGFKGLLRALVQDCRLSDVRFMMDAPGPVSGPGLAMVAEALLLSGHADYFFSLLLRYLGGCRAESEGTMQGLYVVSKALSLARVRRYLSPCPLSDEERASIARAWSALEGFLDAAQERCSPPSSSGSMAFHLVQRLVTQEREHSIQSAAGGAAAAVGEEQDEERGSSWSDSSGDVRGGTFPHAFDDEVSIFPFLTEHLVVPTSSGVSGCYTINDLSTELQHYRPPRRGGAKAADVPSTLLYSSRLFPGAYQMELRSLRRAHSTPHEESLLTLEELEGMQGMLQNLVLTIRKGEGDEDDAQGDLEEEDDDDDDEEEEDEDEEEDDYDDDTASVTTNASFSSSDDSSLDAGASMVDNRRFHERMFTLGMGSGRVPQGAGGEAVVSADVAFSDHFFASQEPHLPEAAAAVPAASRGRRDYNGILFGEIRLDDDGGDQ